VNLAYGVRRHATDQFATGRCWHPWRANRGQVDASRSAKEAWLAVLT
jgi:hypothetical protein